MYRFVVLCICVERESRERKLRERENGVVRERAAVRRGRHSGGRNGTAGGVPGAASVRAGVAWSHQVLPHHARPSPPHLRGRLAQIFRRCPPSRLVHQALTRLQRSFSSLLCICVDTTRFSIVLAVKLLSAIAGE